MDGTAFILLICLICLNVDAMPTIGNVIKRDARYGAPYGQTTWGQGMGPAGLTGMILY